MLETIGAWLQSAYALSVLPLGLAWALTPALARRTAAVRHHVWAVALAIAIVAPVARAAGPRLSVPLLPASDIVSPLQPAPVFTANAFRPATRREPHTASSPAWSATRITVLVWMLGAVPLLCLRVLRRTRLSRLVAEASSVDSHANVRSHARVGVPMLAGLWRPTILLPLPVTEWPIDTREAVLVHERAHVQRYDHAMALLSDVVTTVYWLNPLAWVAAAALEREREYACDEEVLRAGIKPSVYAALLLTVAETLPAHGAATVPSIAGGRLDARIRAVLHQAPHSGRVPLSWPATIALIGACALLVASVRLVARTPPQAKPAERPAPDPNFALSGQSLATNASPAVEARSASRPAQAPSQPAPAARTPLADAVFQAGSVQGSLRGAFQFDTKGVDFGPWLKHFISQVYSNWHAPQEVSTRAGHVVITFYVHKSGALTDIIVTTPWPVDSFNTAAFGSLVASNPTPPLPPEYPDEKAFFMVTFFYNEPVAGVAPAQVLGSIAGTAKDGESGIPLKGVTVTVASSALTEGSRTATTDRDGIYTVTDLPAGTYSLEFRLAEYSTVMRDQLQVAIDATATVDVAMKEDRIRD